MGVGVGTIGSASTWNVTVLLPAFLAQSLWATMATYVPGASSSSWAVQSPLASARPRRSFSRQVPPGVEMSIATSSASPIAVPACPFPRRVGCVPTVASGAGVVMDGSGATSSSHVSSTDGALAVAVFTAGVWTVGETRFAPPPPPPPLIGRFTEEAPPPPPP